MNFGMIPYGELIKENFILPEISQPYLPGIKNEKPLFFLGLSKWTYKEEEKRKNSPNPKPGTLPFYATFFNAVELNVTHHVIPKKENIEKWYNDTIGIDFKFCPKFYKGITHRGALNLSKFGLTKEFIETTSLFKEKLGTAFIQSKEKYTPKVKKDLLDYLKALPENYELSIEVRNAEWYENKELFSSFVKELNSLKKGTVIVDSPGRRDVVHMQLSNTTAFVRFNCQGDNDLDQFRIQQWKNQLSSWYQQGLEKCYFFLHIHNSNYETEFFTYAKQELKF